MFPSTREPRARAGVVPRRGLFAPPILAGLAALLLCALAGGAAAGPAQGGARARITTASGVRLRSAPDAAAGEVMRLPLGVVVEELERTGAKARVGEAEDYWYRVSAPGGAAGWVFGALTEQFDASRREETYRRIAEARVNYAAASFAELADTVRFLDRATKEVTRRDALAELELARLLALGRSLASIGLEDLEKAPYKEWVREHEAQIVYSEPAGQHFVRSELLWDLQRRYADLAFAERAAWAAAQNPLPGECEGYLPCSLYLEAETAGRYLKLYPGGPRAAEAVGEIADFLSSVAEDLKGRDPVHHVPPDERAAFRKSLAELRSRLAPVKTARAAEALRALDDIARRIK